MKRIIRFASILAFWGGALVPSPQYDQTFAVEAINDANQAAVIRERLANAISTIQATHEASRQLETVQRRHVQQVGLALPWRSTLRPSCLRQRSYLLNQPLECWITAADAPALRALLNDEDGGIRAMAAEALATLHYPEDVSRLAKLVNDQANAALELIAPMVGQVSYPGDAIEPGPEAATRYFWRKTTVRDHVALGLSWMLGECCPREIFDWQLNLFHDTGPPHSQKTECSATTLAHLSDLTAGDPQDHLWYWQEYIHRSLHAVEEASAAKELKLQADNQGPPLSSYDSARKAKQEWMRSFFAEMRSWPAERRAMVRLLACDAHQGGADMAFDKPQNLMFFGPLELGLEKERTLELLNGIRVWPAERRDEGGCNQVVERLAMAWEECFTPEDVPHLMARFRSGDDLWWSAQTALLVAVANLMPSTGKASDNPGTAEGFLRGTLRSNQGIWLRARAATELMHKGLEIHWPLVKERFFAERERDDEFSERILKWFIHAAEGDATTNKLIELITDERYRPLWLEAVEWSGKGGGPAVLRNGKCARMATGAVNARLKHEVITQEDLQAFLNPEHGGSRLQKVLARVQKFPTH